MIIIDPYETIVECLKKRFSQLDVDYLGCGYSWIINEKKSEPLRNNFRTKQQSSSTNIFIFLLEESRNDGCCQTY